MEVHAHSHTSDPDSHRGKKKFTHYLWEFLMLFLAVFCGFLAENFREHQVEHNREKKFMASLIYDLRQDTAELNSSTELVTYAHTLQDSVLLFLNNYIPGDFLNRRFDFLIAWSLSRFSVVFNEATALQLKNAGNLRLIRNQEIIRKISQYWTEQENTKISIERYIEYRKRNREYFERLVDFAEIEMALDSLVSMPEKGMKVIDKDPTLWAEYKNNFAHCWITTKGVLLQLRKQKEMADELIKILSHEYHLK